MVIITDNIILLLSTTSTTNTTHNNDDNNIHKNNIVKIKKSQKIIKIIFKNVMITMVFIIKITRVAIVSTKVNNNWNT